MRLLTEAAEHARTDTHCAGCAHAEREEAAGAVSGYGRRDGQSSEWLQWARRLFPLDGNGLRLTMAMSAQL